MSMEHTLEALGKFGKFQIMTFLLVGIGFGWTCAWQLFAIVFIGYINSHHCKASENHTLEESVPSVVNEDGTVQYSACYQYADPSVDNTTAKCSNGWNYTTDGFDEGGTICMEWDLVCDRDSYVELSQTLFNVGVMLGFFIFTPFGDKYGRKKVYFFCLLVMNAFGVALAFAPNFIAFCAFQFLTGSFAAGLFLQGFVLTCEIFPTSVRTFMAPMTSAFSTIGMMLLSVWAYFLRDWRWLQLGISVSGIPVLLYVFWCPESLRWLVAQGREEDAKVMVRKIAKFNGVEMREEDIDLTLEETEGDVKQVSVCQLLRSPRPRRYMFIMIFIIFVNNLMYQGLSLMMGAVAGDIYVNFFINATMEIPALFLSVLAMAWLGRRYPLAFFQIFAACFMAISATCSEFELGGIDKGKLITGLAFISKFGTTGAYGIQLIYGQEIFPTNVRSTCLGITAGSGFIGSILAPYTVFLYRKVQWIPGVIFAVCSFAGGVATFWLPETLGRPLPSTVEEIAGWSLVPSREEREAFKEKQQEEKAKKATKSNAVAGESHPNSNTNLAFIPDSKCEPITTLPISEANGRTENGVPCTRL